MMSILEKISGIGSFSDLINESPDILKEEGVSVRVGNRIMKMTVTSEEILPEEELKAEYEKKLKIAIQDIKDKAEEEKAQFLHAFREYENDVKKRKDEVDKLLSAKRIMPVLTEEDFNKGLAVSTYGASGYCWYYRCVYAPRYINEKEISPAYAKKLITPIMIHIYCDKNFNTTKIEVNKIIGGKFIHYHGSRNWDCWGNFEHSNKKAKDASEALKIAQDALSVLETINEFSLLERSPKGLPRFATLKKYLLKDDEVKKDEEVKLSRENERMGLTTNANDNLENVWSV